ncbi:hypothetical protein NDU88_005525 [Pleurodeles waltl]|uniref:Uncharacterized protein n=1 Tax=Pleurodeles waltl TaxID=8319 RepID=A0AAV7WUY3_PLEWA|nr:hypothetical protein NDU88_005525 [Pleurodeles waltl]
MQSHGAEDKRTRLSGFCSVILEPDFAHFLDTISITYFLCDISWIVFVEVGSTFEKLRGTRFLETLLIHGLTLRPFCFRT